MAEDYAPADVYLGLRKLIFGAKPAGDASGHDGDAGHVFGVVMETGYPAAVATLVALWDGTVSLYFSKGGGIIGLGPHDGPRIAARALLNVARQFSGSCSPTSEFPLPRKQRVRFYLLTRDGALTGDAEQEELGRGRHPLSPLFMKCHQLIAAIRVTEQALKAKQSGPPPH